MAIVVAKNLDKTYGTGEVSVRALRDVSFSIEVGSVVSFIGPSGSGNDEPYFDRFRTSPSFNKVINAILCSFVGLLFAVTVRFAWGVHWDVRHVLLASAAFIALLLKIDILWVVAVGVVISIALFT